MRYTRWDQVGTTESSNEVLLLLSRWHLAQTGQGSESLEIRRLVEASDFYGLCHYELRYDGLSVNDSKHLRQVLAFYQKRNDLDLGIDVRQVAWRKFIEAEQLCKSTNEVFRAHDQGRFQFRPRVASVMYRAQRKISDILGDLPSVSELKLRFGPGATTQVKKKDASVRRKLSQMYACSQEALIHREMLMAEMPLWSGHSGSQGQSPAPIAVHRGKVSFVRKNAKTDRTIGVEPMLNGMLQLGIGAVIAERLSREGISLKDQTRNQRLAQEGSLTGALATLDLSSASDTIATLLVRSLLPDEWFLFLSSIRTSVFKSGEEVFNLEKFSSMGNGFTFPLESLLFYSLAYACCRPEDHQKISVYGDDIIVPVYAVPLLNEVLTTCGFLVNMSKSYWSGSFRESCGKDYLSGTDIRPCYIKGPLSGHTCFVLHNHYVRTGQPGPAAIVLEVIDENLRLFGPDGFGDGHLISDCPLEPHGRDRGWGGFTFETYTYKPNKAFYRLGADYVYPSYSIYIKDNPVQADVNETLPPEPLEQLRWHSGSKRNLWLLKWGSRGVGPLRPDRQDARYVLKEKNGRKQWFLEDTLPGYQGYKRIKVYTF